MQERTQPNIGLGLLAIHSAITRGLSVAIRTGEALPGSGFADRTAKDGFVRYVASLASVANGHHLTEDDLAFPYFRGILPNAPYDVLASEHQLMHPLLARIGNAGAKLEAGSDPDEALRDLMDALSHMDALWQGHYPKEEEHFSVPVLAELISPEDHVHWTRAFLEHSQKHMVPDYLTVPFLLYNLSAEQRMVFWQEMPAVVTEQLLPVVWRDKWAAMDQFLLPAAEA